MTAYSIPYAFFPVASDIPPRTNAFAEPIKASLEQTEALAAQLAYQLRTCLVNPIDFREQVAQLRHMLEVARTQLDSDYSSLSASNNEVTGENTLKTVLRNTPESIVDNYVVYDKYFHVIRVPQITFEQFSAQLIDTCIRELSDLPFATLGLDEVTAIVHTILFMVRFINDREDTHIEKTPPTYTNELNTKDSTWPTVWGASSLSPDELIKKVAFYRWVIGHHFFNLSTMLCRAYLLRVINATDQNNKKLSFYTSRGFR